jgi:hypothetical protein
VLVLQRELMMVLVKALGTGDKKVVGKVIQLVVG